MEIMWNTSFFDQEIDEIDGKLLWFYDLVSLSETWTVPNPRFIASSPDWAHSKVVPYQVPTPAPPVKVWPRGEAGVMDIWVYIPIDSHVF